MTSYYSYQPTASIPVSVPVKVSQQRRNVPTYNQYSVSPPERPESISTHSGAGVYSSASSQYASSEYDSSAAGTTSVDLLDYMNERLSHSYNPLPMDANLAKQSKMSGQLNAKTQELLALQKQAKSRLAKTRANFADGMQAARETHCELEYASRKAHALNQRAAKKYPDQYAVAVSRYPVSTGY